jgi:tetratricopeptide (TPR) repeat protein
MTPEQLFNSAYSAFSSGNIDTARELLTKLRATVKSNPGVLHLSALAERRGGDLPLALKLFEEAVRFAPQDAELHANYANALAAAGDRTAIDHYSKAIALAPGRNDIRLNRAISSRQFNDPASALEDIEHLAAQGQNDARFWAVAGDVYWSAQLSGKARDAFTKAVKLEPDRVTAQAGLGEIELFEGSPQAAVHYANALRVEPANPDLLIGLAQAYELEGDYELAIATLMPQSIANPVWLDGLTAVTRLMTEAGQADAAIRHFEDVIAASGKHGAAWPIYIAYLRSMDRPHAAMDAIEKAMGKCRPTQDLIALEAALATDIGEHDRATAALRGLPPQMAEFAQLHVRHALRFGDYDRASKLAKAHLAHANGDIAMWALQSLSWRLLDDEHEQWLNPENVRAGVLDIGFPGDEAELAELLRALHVARHHPGGQSLRGGTQTRGGLFNRKEPILIELKDHILAAVENFWRGLPTASDRHPLLRHVGQRPEFCGSWSVRLTKSGFHVSHIHPAGLLSSAFYISLPPSLGGTEKAGWLEIGSAPAELDLPLAPYAIVEPKPGRLVLFPSYLFHGTRPFGDGERLTVAFDIRAR